MTTSLQIDYQFQSETFSEAWKTGIASNKTAKVAMNEMVRILLEEHKDWSIREALMTICSEHEDLEGLSVSSMYRHLSAENRKMLQDSNVSDDKDKTPKKGTEQTPIDEDAETIQETADKLPRIDSKDFNEKLEADKIEEQYKEEQAAIPKDDMNSVSWKTGLSKTDIVMEAIQREIPKLRNRGWKMVEIIMRVV